MEGSSPASLTYRSPPLSDIHKDKSKFELVNLEVWGFTPCRTEEKARILEYKNMFFKRLVDRSNNCLMIKTDLQILLDSTILWQIILP